MDIIEARKTESKYSMVSVTYQNMIQTGLAAQAHAPATQCQAKETITYPLSRRAVNGSAGPWSQENNAECISSRGTAASCMRTQYSSYKLDGPGRQARRQADRW
jgi:hypothetical protein